MNINNLQDNRIDPSHGKLICKRGGGFTLIEIAIVLAILGAIIGSSILSLSSVREKRQREKNSVSMSVIEDALIGYALINGKLPCPDIGVDGGIPTTAYDGVGDVDGSNVCQSDYGVLPWKDLGVNQFDPWGHYYGYHVVANFSGGSVNGNDLIKCQTTSDLVVLKDVDPSLAYPALLSSGINLGSDIPVVVVSHGKNGEGRILPTPQSRTTVDTDSNEDKNAPPMPPVMPVAGVDLVYIVAAGDDLVTYVSPMKVKSKLMAAGWDMSPCSNSTSTTSTTSTSTTTSVPTTTTSVSTTTTSVSTTTTSVPTTTTSVPTTTSTSSTTSTTSTTTSIPTTTTTTTTTTIPASLMDGANAGCWTFGQGVSDNGDGRTLYDRRASGFLSNSAPGCPALEEASPNLCYSASFTWNNTDKLDEEYFTINLNGNYTPAAGGGPYSLSCDIQYFNSSKTTCGGIAVYNKSAKTISIALGAYDVNSMGTGDLQVRFFAEDSDQAFRVDHEIVACP